VNNKKKTFNLKINSDGMLASNKITKNDWGYYLTDSCNSTLRKNNFKTALVVSQLTKINKIFVKIVHKKKLKEFNKYLKDNKSFVLTWLDEWKL